MTLNEHLFASPTWLLIWINILGIVNFGAIIFAIKDWRARFVLIAMILNIVIMSALFAQYGYTRILGLSHVIVWTPLLAYLWKNRKAYPERVWTGRYIMLVLVINGISLFVDYIDVIRYLLSDRAPL